jgi:hypothetical protein
MGTLARDVEWRNGMENALAAAKVARKAVVLKPLGQGMGITDDW